MAGSGDELAAAAGDRSRLRASDADREQVVTVLKAAFAQGRLTCRARDLAHSVRSASPGTRQRPVPGSSSRHFRSPGNVL